MNKTKKLVLSGILTALCVVGSMVYIPLGVSKCCPVQHLINILSAVLLGPWYGVAIAFVSSCLRNLLGLGTPLAFAGSMCGALLSGILYKVTKKYPLACIGELFGTSVIGGTLAYPIVVYVLGKQATLFAYVIPFFISSCGGTIIAIILLAVLSKTNTLERLKQNIDK